MTPTSRTGVLPALVLHQSQFDAIEATARDMARGSPGGPRVSKAWALSELLARGCAELETQLANGALAPLRATSPPRGAPAKVASASRAFRRQSPVTMDLALLRRVRALAPKMGRILKERVTVAAVAREAIFVGHAARERERHEAEQRAEEIRRALVLSGYARDAATIQVVGVKVISPYRPPGRKSEHSEWGQPVTLQGRAAADGPTMLPDTSCVEAAAEATRSPGRGSGRSRARRAPRRARRRRTPGGSADSDDGPRPPPTSRATDAAAATVVAS